MAQLRAHMKHTHDNVGQKFVCHICSKEVANELNLKQHLRRQHFKARKPEEFLPCPECGKTFASKIQLNCHHKAVHEVDQIKCNACNNTYKNKYSLNKHMSSSHFGIFDCDVCSCAHTIQFSLSNHMKKVHFSSRIALYQT